MPSFTLLRQDRTVTLGDSREFSSVKVAFYPIRLPNGRPIILIEQSGEHALKQARRLYPELKEILLAVEPYSEEKHGNPSRRIH